MALQQSVGAKIGVSATLSTTHDDDATTGFPSLTFTNIGRINGYPDLDGTFDVTTFEDLETGEEIKFADIFRAGNGTFMVGLDEADAGQVILEGNKGGKLAFAFTLKSGAVYYRNAILTSYRPTNINVGGVVMAELGLEFEKTTVKVAAS